MKTVQQIMEETGAQANIQDLFGRDDPNARALVVTLVDAVREGYIEGGTLKLADGVTAKLKPKDGMVVVSRTVKHEHQIDKYNAAQAAGRAAYAGWD